MTAPSSDIDTDTCLADYSTSTGKDREKTVQADDSAKYTQVSTIVRMRLDSFFANVEGEIQRLRRLTDNDD
jgi:hypothetical protein